LEEIVFHVNGITACFIRGLKHTKLTCSKTLVPTPTRLLYTMYKLSNKTSKRYQTIKKSITYILLK